MPPKSADEFVQAVIEASKRGDNVYEVYIKQFRAIILSIANKARGAGKDPWTALAEDHLERTYRIGAAFQGEINLLQEALHEAHADLEKYRGEEEGPEVPPGDPDTREQDPGGDIPGAGVHLETEPAG